MNAPCAEGWLRNAVVLQVAHVTETYGPVQALTGYLRRRCRRLATIEHPFLDSCIPSSTLTVYERDAGVVRAEAPKGRSEVRQYVRDFVLTLRFALKLGGRVDLYVGMNSLDTLPGLLLRALGRVRSVIFYTVDYADRRFESAYLNRVYKFLDCFCVRRADAVFSNTRRVMAVRRALGLPDARNIRAPNGVHLRDIPPLRDGGPISRLIYVGRLTRTHGVQTVIGAVLGVAAEFPDLGVLIVGSGPYEDDLKQLIAERSLTDRFQLLGAVPNREALNLLGEGGIGLAPYTLDEDYVRYCDPVKVKEYLACGCPVLISDVPEVAEEVARCDAGLVYRDAHELRAHLRRLLSDRALHGRLRRNAIEMGRCYDWDRIFDGAFRECSRAILSDHADVTSSRSLGNWR